jgi:ABC-type lipopolysaccharide export system ATPase subunit
MNRRVRLGIGYLLQESSIFKELSGYDNLKIIAENLPIDSATINSIMSRTSLMSPIDTMERRKAAVRRKYGIELGYLMGKDDYRDLRQAGDSEDHIHRRS